MTDYANNAVPAVDPEFLNSVYHELRELAARQLAQESPGHTLQPTALVHEAFLRLAEQKPQQSKSQFIQAAAAAMRRILIDHARRRLAGKRGGNQKRVPLDDAMLWTQSPDVLLDLDDALDRFAREEPRKAELVILRVYGGFSLPEIAESLGISLPSAERWWAFAKTWLYAELFSEIAFSQ